MTESDARRPPCSNINKTVISLWFYKLDPKGGRHDIMSQTSPQIQLSCKNVIEI